MFLDAKRNHLFVYILQTLDSSFTELVIFCFIAKDDVPKWFECAKICTCFNMSHWIMHMCFFHLLIPNSYLYFHWRAVGLVSVKTFVKAYKPYTSPHCPESILLLSHSWNNNYFLHTNPVVSHILFQWHLCRRTVKKFDIYKTDSEFSKCDKCQFAPINT